MSVNAVNGTETNNYVPRRPSVMSSILNNAILGAAFGASIPYIFKPDVDTFVAQGSEILEKAKGTEALKTAINKGSHSLDDLLKLGRKGRAEKLASEPEVLKGFKTVLSKYKWQNAIRQAGIGVVLCGAIGLVFGLINKSAEKKAMKKAAQVQ